MPSKPTNNLSRLAKPTVASFKTSKGSEYTVDGASTIRNKSLHAEHGPADTGLKPKSSKTVYIGTEAQSDVAYAVGQLDRGASIKMEGDELVVRYNYGRADKPRQMEKRFPVAHTPEKGMAPVEFWDDKNSVHVGNEITEVTHAAPTGTAHMANRKPRNPLARPGRPVNTDVMPGEGGYVEMDAPTLQRSVAGQVTDKGRKELVDAVVRAKTRTERAAAAERLKAALALDAERLAPSFAQSGENVLPSERQALADAEARAMNRPGTGLFNKDVEGQIKDRANAKYALKQAATRGTLEPETARLLDAAVRSPKPGLSAVTGGLGEAEAAAQFAKTGALGEAAGAAEVAGGLGGLVSKVPWLTKVFGALGLATLAYEAYDNTVGRRNEARGQEATSFLDAALRSGARTQQMGDEAYAQMLPGLASSSAEDAFAADRSATSNALQLQSLVSRNQQSLQAAAQVTPMSYEEYALRVKAAIASRGG